MTLFGGKYRSPVAWTTQPLPAPPHVAATPLETAYWQCTSLAWDSPRFHEIVAAWLGDPDHLRALLAARPGWCESTRACDVAVANLFDMCLNYRPCACFMSPGAQSVTYIAHYVDGPARQRRVECMPAKRFAAEAMRVLLPHVLRACRAEMPVRVPMALFGVDGVWIGPSAASIRARNTPIAAAWRDEENAATLAAMAGDVVRDLEAGATGHSTWMDVLCSGDAPTGAKRAAKVARDDVIRALHRNVTSPKHPAWFEDVAP